MTNLPPSLTDRLRSPESEERRAVALELKGKDSPEAREALYTLLGDPDWRVRKTAAETIAADPPARHAEALLATLHSSDNAGLRNSAIEVLARHGEATLAPALAHLNATDDDDVRIAILHLLSVLRRPVPLDILRPFLASENKNVTAAAVACLGRCAGAESGPCFDILIDYLRGADLWLAFHAAEALGELGDARAVPELEARYQEGVLRKSIFRSIGMLGDVRAVPFLVDCLVEGRKIRMDALETLCLVRRRIARSGDAMTERRFEAVFREKFPAERLDELVSHGVGHSDHLIRLASVEALGWLRSEKAVGHLVAILADSALRPFAARALVRAGEVAVDPLAAALGAFAFNEEALAAAIEVLGKIGHARAVRPLSRILIREEPEIRLAAVEALGAISGPDAAPELMAQLGDPNAAVRASAVRGLARALARHASEELTAELERVLDSTDAAVRAGALSVYGQLYGVSAAPRLLRGAKDESEEVRQAAVTLMADVRDESFMPALAAALSDESSRVRQAAIRALAARGASSDKPETRAGALERISALIEDEDMWVRAEAAEAMGTLAGTLAETRTKERVSTLLLARFASEKPPVQIAILKALGGLATPAASDMLMKTASGGQGELRRAALEALARVPGTAARRILEENLRDAQWRIAASALDALVARDDAVLAKESLIQVLLRPTDALLRDKAILALAALGAEEALPTVLGFLDQENPPESAGAFLLAMRDRAPEALRAGIERLSPRGATAAEILLRKPEA